MVKRVVVSLFNTPSGKYSWWDDLSIALTEALRGDSVDHFSFFRSYTPDSNQSLQERRIATTANLSDLGWLERNVGELVDQFDEAVLHTHSHYAPFKIPAFVRARKNLRWCITEHRLGSTSAPVYKRWARSLLRRLGYMPEYVIGVSRAVHQRNVSLYGKRNQFCIVNGINLPDPLPKPIPKRVPAKNLLYVGRLDPRKGIWNLLEAIKLIAECRPEWRLQLTVVGDGPPLEKMKQFATDNGLQGLLALVGHQHDPSPFYQQADLVIVPTAIKEALSLVALESRRHGVPVLYANSGGLPETMEEGETGVALTSIGARAIADDVVGYIENHDLQQHILKNSQRNLGFFRFERMIADYRRFYQTVFAQMPGNQRTSD